MSALTVERLLGNNTLGFTTGRMTMSPESSDNVSESSVTSSGGRESHPQTPVNHPRHHHLLQNNRDRTTPSRYSKIQLLLGNSTSDEEDGVEEDPCFHSHDENTRTNPDAVTTTTEFGIGMRRILHPEISTAAAEDPIPEEKVMIENENNNCVMIKRELGPIVGMEDDNNTSRVTSVSLLSSPTSQKSSLRLNEDELTEDSGDESKRGSCILRPPSRPSSSASETSSSSCFFSSPSPKSFQSGGGATQPQIQTTIPHLKFSICDILSPGFGQRAIQRTTTTTIGTTRQQPYPSQRPTARVKSSGRPSSIKNNRSSGSSEPEGRGKSHSEDSNGSSCNGGRREVVDEAKVNPSVPKGPLVWPAWVYCTRYSDRPSSGPRSRRIRKPSDMPQDQPPEEKRPRTAFTAEQLGKLKHEFEENRYLNEKRRQDLARDLKLHENQIKIWFQNKRAKLKKSNGPRGDLALQLMAQGLYNHSTVPIDEDEDYIP